MTATKTPLDSNELILHPAGSAVQPFPGLAAALRIVRNALAELPGVRLELVVQGSGVAQLASEGREAEEAAALAAEDGVTITACRSSLRSAESTMPPSPPELPWFPQPFAHLAQRQFIGTAYMLAPA